MDPKTPGFVPHYSDAARAALAALRDSPHNPLFRVPAGYRWKEDGEWTFSFTPPAHQVADLKRLFTGKQLQRIFMVGFDVANSSLANNRRDAELEYASWQDARRAA